MESPKSEMRKPREDRLSSWGDLIQPCPCSALVRLLRSYVPVGLATLLLAWPTLGLAQYSIDWTSLDGGGGVRTGGVYAVSGTIGQPDAGTLTGGHFALAGGFWAIVAAIQTPGAPMLSITRSNAAVILSWP